jgi:hypothetical protein
VLKAKFRKLLPQAVPVVMLVMQVIDEQIMQAPRFVGRADLCSVGRADPWQLGGRATWAADKRG